MPPASPAALARQLMMYTRDNPDACDSAAGIARWWLEPGQPVDMPALAQALDTLVAQEVFAERIATDGRRSFRRSCSRERLQRLLSEGFP